MLERRAGDVHQRLGHFIEVIHHLHIVVGRVDIAALEFLQRRQQRVFAFARLVEEVVRLLDHVAQHLAVLLEDGDQRAVVDLRGALHRVAHLVAQVGDDVVVGLGLLLDDGVLLALFQEVAMYEHPAAEDRDDDEGGRSAVDQRQSHDEGDEESAQCRDEPSGHDGHDARNAVYGAFAAPCAVGERRTHRHHEADVGGRQREFERRGHGDQQRRGRQVDRCADHVVGRTAVLDVLVFEAARDRIPQVLGDRAFDACADVEGCADDRAREDRRSVLLLTPVVLRRKRKLGFGDVHGLFRGPQREDHQEACGQQDQEIGRNVLVQGPHEHLCITGFPGDGVGVEPGDGHADEVHQIVAREGQRQRERTRQDRDAQNVDLEPLDKEQQQRADDPADEQSRRQVAVDELDEGIVGEDGLEALENGEIDDRRQRGAAPQRPVTAEKHRVAERKDHARDVHHERAAGEGDHDRQQDGRDDTHGARGVDVVPERRDALIRIVGDLVDRHGDRGTQQAEDQRHGGRGRESPRIVEVQQDDVGEHDAQIEHHHFVEGEQSGIEHAAAGDLHHAARRHDTDDDADGRHGEDDLHRGCFGADSGVEEIDCVVRDADEKT